MRLVLLAARWYVAIICDENGLQLPICMMPCRLVASMMGLKAQTVKQYFCMLFGDRQCE
jgi:hypothetical protein